ncbi:MAG: nucleoside triphosphate pyrophosphohydrolase [Crocinitomicaceae bacterium]|nr:nucleoside triphosphate pyrophosphohydrolase [Crocinitomicaceae bacterium]MDC1385533.1 nucleoside triphosphate pyrophosphohydrolase [Crocinitomicaceae bacterium]|tara:strand:+ start:3678 stop:4457 length:780 start_codon:yes stop_codon:yes gene_type:complete
MDERLVAFKRLLDIMDELREKCPWDKKQTLESLRHLTIEETYELADAIIDNDLEELKGEIGDILLHMVFYCKIGQEKNAFDITSVLDAICNKLVHRHPHIYGGLEVTSEEEVKQNWEKLKLKEGKDSVLEGVPKSLPALVKAARIQEKVKGIGFEWEKREDVWGKVEEEMQELSEEVESGASQEKIEEEFGDVMFSLINYSRFINVNPENALSKTNKKFINRFQLMETLMKDGNVPIEDSNLETMDIYWEKAKIQLRNK